MGSYLKIDTIGLAKLNNAEYTNFINRTLNQAVAVGIEKIGASDTLIDGITANVNKMTDIVAQSRASVETAQIAEVDKKADELIVYLMALSVPTARLPFRRCVPQPKLFTLKQNLTWDASKTVRMELDMQYDDLVTIAFVTSVATPSKEATDFVVYMNKLIADTNAAYNQRIAQSGKKKEEDTSDETSVG